MTTATLSLPPLRKALIAALTLSSSPSKPTGEYLRSIGGTPLGFSGLSINPNLLYIIND
ncbi:hypothetical protein [Vulcanisaeta distributa]|uniref:hypothetical protein n=1 Tax=Vulcanisaeta distributa TaxID=164451 RepID=UPI001FB1D055|nr:hypothetical protein [Vulcanisaeta distributa]